MLAQLPCCVTEWLICPKVINEERKEHCYSTSEVAHKYSYKSYLYLTDMDDCFQLKALKDSVKRLE